MKRLMILAAAAMALGACATTAPPYEAAAVAGATGYYAAPPQNGRTTVLYTGARNMNRAQVAEYALLRAAELTLESGQEWFAVLSTTSQQVDASSATAGEEIQARGGLAGGASSGTGSGGGQGGTSSPGVRDATVQGGPSTGGFGGGDVPYQVLERWTPPQVNQTILVIQMGSGAEASFEGLETAPEIFAARAVADEIRAKLAP